MEIYEKTDILPAQRWTLLEFVSPSGRKAIEDWRKGMAAGTFRADLDAFLKVMVKKSAWDAPDFKPMKGKLAKFHELRWFSGKTQHRIIGFLGREREFIMLVGCTHKQNVYKPAEALESVLKRKKQLDLKEATTSEYKVLTDR